MLWFIKTRLSRVDGGRVNFYERFQSLYSSKHLCQCQCQSSEILNPIFDLQFLNCKSDNVGKFDKIFLKIFIGIGTIGPIANLLNIRHFWTFEKLMKNEGKVEKIKKKEEVLKKRREMKKTIRINIYTSWNSISQIQASILKIKMIKNHLPPINSAFDR